MSSLNSGRQGGLLTRLGDKTTHYGTVIEAAPYLMHMGIPVALDVHMAECPGCDCVRPTSTNINVRLTSPAKFGE